MSPREGLWEGPGDRRGRAGGSPSGRWRGAVKIAVLGGGVSGLTAAHRLRRQAEVVVFEARDRPGGNIRTDEIDGCQVEWGPNGFLDSSPETLELVARLGLTDRLLPARSQAARRFIYRQGRLRELPAKPRAFLTSDILPLGGRLRALLEPFARAPPETEETIYDFAHRRLGRSAAQILVDAMVTGIFAGDPRRLEIGAALPKLKAMEQAHGSLLRAAKGRGVGPAGTLTSFGGGMEVLICALAADLDLRTGNELSSLPSGFDRIVCALPARRAADLVEGRLARLLREIPMAPVAVLALVFDQLPQVPDAFGFLVPRGQGLRILGTLYDSSVFAGRAPEGRRLVRVMIGGRRDPGAVDLDDGALLDLAARDLEQAWGAFPPPRSHAVFRHRLGIPQYELGHRARLEEIHALCPPQLHLIGSSYHGVSLNSCIQEALELDFPART